MKKFDFGNLIALNHLCETEMICARLLKENKKDTQQTQCTIHHKFLTWKTLKEVKTTGPSPEMIHYQYKSYTPKFYSKQVRVLCKSKEYDISLTTKPNRKDTKTTTKTHNTWLITVAVMSGCRRLLVYSKALKESTKKREYELSKICFSSTVEKCPFFVF